MDIENVSIVLHKKKTKKRNNKNVSIRLSFNKLFIVWNASAARCKSVHVEHINILSVPSIYTAWYANNVYLKAQHLVIFNCFTWGVYVLHSFTRSLERDAFLPFRSSSPLHISAAAAARSTILPPLHTQTNRIEFGFHRFTNDFSARLNQPLNVCVWNARTMATQTQYQTERKSRKQKHQIAIKHTI